MALEVISNLESKRDDDAKDKSGDDELELLKGKRF